MSQVNFPHKIRYEYEKEDKSRPQYAHGIWGGINPQGEIEMHFYLESDRIPDFSERSVHADGSFGQEMVSVKEDARVVTRHIHSQVLLNYHTARALVEWLEEKLEVLEAEEVSSHLASQEKEKNREQ